jgi:hypothetical protein
MNMTPVLNQSDPVQLEQLIMTFKRRDDVATLLKPGGMGVELGVAEGGFSERILKRSKLAHLYSIDMWAGDRGHDVHQYKKAVGRLDPFKMRNSILRMRFDEALDLFPNGSCDFIYVDGYAHTGEEEGRTFRDWFPKLKSGGIFAGDDYSPEWPLVVKEVDKFVAENNLKMFVIDCQEKDDWASQYPTWFAFKP